MVAGIYRVGGSPPYRGCGSLFAGNVLPGNLKYVKEGRRVEVSLDLYPGQIFGGEVGRVWRGNGIGQYLPSENTSRRPRSIQVYNRRAGFGCDLHEQRVRRMGRAAQNLHSRPFLGSIGSIRSTSDEFQRIRRPGLKSTRERFDIEASRPTEEGTICRICIARHCYVHVVRSNQWTMSISRGRDDVPVESEPTLPNDVVLNGTPCLAAAGGG